VASTGLGFCAVALWMLLRRLFTFELRLELLEEVEYRRSASPLPAGPHHRPALKIAGADDPYSAA
jgi:hypothetical protein